ncbi:MAG: tetratricopeptide repeat protein [Chitinophagales bacterium]
MPTKNTSNSNSIKLLTYSAATFAAAMAENLLSPPILTAAIKTAGGIAGNIAAEHYNKVEFDQIRNYFFQQPKGTDITNHHLLKAYRDAVSATLGALYANYADNLEQIYESHNQPFPSQHKMHLQAVERKIKALQQQVQDQMLQSMIAENITESDLQAFAEKQSDALTAFAENELTTETLKGHGKVFPDYFKANFGNSLQLYFGEELKNNPQAWIAFQRLWMRDVLESLSKLEDLEESIRGALGYEAFKIKQAFEEHTAEQQNFQTALLNTLDSHLSELEQNRQAAIVFLKEQLTESIEAAHRQTRKTVTDEHDITRQIFKQELKGIVSNKFLTAPPSTPPKNFLGREKDLKDIRQKLQNSGNVVLVNGIGGIGKTTLAQAYWREHQTDYDYMAWFTVVSDIQSAVLDSGIETSLGIEVGEGQTTETRFREVWRKLANLQGTKLLVIDNANDADDLAQQSFPFSQTSVLLTSRSNLPQFTQHAIGVLSLTKAKELFCDYYPAAKNQTPLLEKLLQYIGRHTLSIELLAKNLQQLRGKGYELQNLYDNLQAKGLLKPDKSRKIRSDYAQHQQKKYEEIIAAMFEIHPLDDYAQWLLLQFAVLPAIPIEYSLMADFLQIKDSPFEGGKGDVTEDEFDETLGELVEKGWLEFEEESNEYKMHQVVQEVIREKMEPNGENCGVLVEGLAWKLRVYAGDNSLKKAPYLVYTDTLLERLQNAQTQDIAALYGNAANIHRSLGDARKALDFQLKSIAILEEILDHKHPDLATSYGNIALTYSDLGDASKALEFQLKDIAILEEILDHKHPSLATSYNNIALTYSDLGDARKALEFQLKSIAIREEILDHKHPSLATSYNNIALTYSDLGDASKALEFQLKSIAIEEEILDHKHPYLATSYNNIALTYSDLGDARKALEFQLKSIAIREEILDHKHPDLATSYGNIALTYSSLGDARKALEFQLKSIAIFEEILDHKHPDLATSYGNIALTYRSLGDASKALEFQLKSIAIREEILDHKHPL